MMDKLKNKSIKTSNYQDKDKKSLVVGGIIVLIIAISPFVYYSYKSFPANQNWETSFFKLKTSFPAWINFAYFFFAKFVPLYLLLFWFFTCKHWWHWIILVPISMYVFQIWGVLNESNSLDEVEIAYLIPLLMVLVPFVYLVRAKLFAKIRGDDLKSFEEELGRKKTLWQQIKDLFQ